MALDIQQNVSLREHSTMRLGGNAAYLVDVHSEDELVQAVNFAKERSLPFKMIGGGSNIIWPDGGYNGLVIVNKIKGFTITPTDYGAAADIGAGEEWDSAVAKTVEAGLSGIEQLSLIPGLAGATPIQNVGAYGREIKDVLISVRAYDTHTSQIVEIPGSECQFAYRDSRFKSSEKGRFLITSIKLNLTKTNPIPPFYPTLQAYLDEHGTYEFTPKTIREAVIAIRSAKLPDPAKVPNSGSFFKNPVVPKEVYDDLQQKFPDIPGWPQSDGQIKLQAGWLIEQAHLKNYHDPKTGMAIWPTQALTFVNEHAHSTADLLAFREMVVTKVKELFGIELEQEPELVNS